MIEVITQDILPVAVTAFVTWFLARRKNDAEAHSAEIDAEVKASEFYKSLLDDSMRRLENAVATIEDQDAKIKKLVDKIEYLTMELRRYKVFSRRDFEKNG